MEGYNIIRKTPDQLGYKDRGIMKWQGLFLSDHTDALKREEEEANAAIEPKEEMSEIAVAEILHEAYVTKSPALIQANVMRNGGYYKDLECMVIGHGGDKIHLLLKDGRNISCSLEEIRNIEFMDPLDWYDKRK